MSNTELKGAGRRAQGETRGGRFGARRLLFICLLSPFALFLVGCRMDMQDQPKYKYYRAGDKKFFPDGSSTRPPVEGAVARQAGPYRDREDYLYTGKSATGAAGALTNASAYVRGNISGGAPGAPTATATGEPDVFPLNIDKAALMRGRERFQIYCTACHGMTGEGDGMIVRRGFQKPPSFYDDRLQENRTPASHFFDVITNGWGAMPDYAASIPPEDRWKIIAYLRALQLSRRLKLEELSPEEQNKVRTAGQQPAGHGEGGTPSPSQPGGEKH
jgi:mono/diheme cytochrome c family protein